MAGLRGLENIFTEEIVTNGEGANYINDVHATGFTLNVDGTDFLGIEGSTYNNPGELGYDNNIVDSIINTAGVGFVAGLQAGDDTLFVGVGGENYSNPGTNLGTFYVDDYEAGPTPDFINFSKNLQPKDPTEYIGVEGEDFNHPDPDEQSQIESNQWLDVFEHKFTPNRKHLDPTEFKGASGTSYSNPGELVGLHYYESYSDAGLGTDYIDNIHATGFTKLKQHKDPSEFLMVDGDAISQGNDNVTNGTLFRQFGNEVFSFGGEQKNKYLNAPGNTYRSKSKLDEDNVALIQQGGVRSNLIQGSEVKNISLEDIWNKHIDDLIDWENVRGKTDGRLDMRYDSGRASVNSFLPLQFSRNGVTHEPYVVRGIGDSKDIVSQHLDDLERVGKYFLSADGVKFIAAQNAMGLLAYTHRRSVEVGKEQYGFFGSSAGLQQFQYTYNPLSAFSTSVPLIKVRINRSFGLDEQKYTDREPAKAFGITIPDITPNKNTKIDGIDNQSDDDNILTTLGGSINKNVNNSIDGTTVSNQGITGDHYTLAPIDVEDETKKLKRGNKDSLTSIEDGYPFFFKDLRNDKILLFRGYIKGLTEQISPTFSPTTFIGRSEPVYTYQNTTRTINFSLDLFANNKDEFTKIYQKLDYLTGMCYPEYYEDNSSLDRVSVTRPKTPLCRMRLGELFGGGTKAQEDNVLLKHGVLGHIQTLSYTYNDESPWNNFDEESRAPMYITANIGFQVIHDQTPSNKTRFYGVNYQKVT